MSERPDDLTEREQWQFAEAAFCDRMAANSRETLIPGWLTRSTHPDHMMQALRCAVSAECWEGLSFHLRRSYYVRKEQEAYSALASAARQSGDVKQAPAESPQSGGEAATPNPNLANNNQGDAR